MDIGMLHLDQEQKTEPTMLLDESFDEREAAFSPNGRWIAYMSDESSRLEVYVRSFPELRGKQRVSADGGTEPLWRRDGTELVYRNGNKMMSVSTTSAAALILGRTELLFEGPYERSSRIGETNYDVAEDGRFLMVLREEGQAEQTMRINVVLNWFEELKGRVPTGK